MSNTRIKICGLTRPRDAEAAARLGADAVGIVFFPASSRAADIETARAVVAALPPFVTAVGLFLDAEADRVRSVVDAVALDVLQFHGREPARFCRSFGRPYIKAIGMAGAIGIDAAGHYPDARGLLIDSHAPGDPGGTGAPFSWERLPARRDFRLILAGGLSAENVAGAVARVRPDAVDVSSGVEPPGREGRSGGAKAETRIREFIEEVRRGNRDAS